MTRTVLQDDRSSPPTPEGASCTRLSQCKPAAAANETAACDEEGTRRCIVLEPCSTTTKPNLECGFGNRCDEAGVCAAGKPGGASCTNDLECASVKCVPKSDAGADSGAADVASRFAREA